MTKEEMRIVFMGTPDFAVASLQALIENNFNVVAVVTNPDKPAGRGRKIQEAAVKKEAIKHNIPILQPTRFKDPEFLSALKSYNPDLQIVVAFKMLPREVWALPKLGTFNLHASLLPKYRGAAPINWAIINGETQSGVTTFLLDEKIDTGAILEQKKVEITETDTAGSLHDKLMTTGATLVAETAELLASGNFTTTPQTHEIDEKRVMAPKIFPADCQIQWDKSTQNIYNHIRGLSPYPAAWSWLHLPSTDKPKKCKIFSTTINNNKPENTKPGTLTSDGKSYLHCVTADGSLAITELQMEGKKRLAITDFLRGAPNLEGATLT